MKLALVFLSVLLVGSAVVSALYYSEDEMLKKLACDDLRVSFGDRVQFKKRFQGITFLVIAKGVNTVTLSSVTNVGTEDKDYNCNEVEKVSR